MLTCNVPDHHFLYSLAYNGFLIIACTVYAVKTRKVGPDDDISLKRWFPVTAHCGHLCFLGLDVIGNVEELRYEAHACIIELY